MKYIKISLSDEDYELLKKYAKATRKYETGSGFTLKSAINQMITIGLESIKETVILDNENKIINWQE